MAPRKMDVSPLQNEGGWTRRALLHASGKGAILLASGIGLVSGGCEIPMPGMGGSSGRGPSESFQPDLDVSLRAVYADAALLPGRATRVASYRASVISGDAANVIPLPGSYLGPILRVRRGQKLRVRLMNELQEPTIIHWHGMHVPPEMDAHPRFAIAPGVEYVYEFEVLDRAGTYWFHPHPHPLAGQQVYEGLAGMLLVSDDEEDAAGLPAGELDLPLVIQDRSFDMENQLLYIDSEVMGMGGMHGSMGGTGAHEGMMSDGFLGDMILVNGQASYVLSVAQRVYRLRLLNGSNARVYKLAWNDGTAMTVIATDGGLLGSPVQRDYVTLAPGERVELWADFSQRPVGTELGLRSLAFSGFEIGMMGTDGMSGMSAGALPHGSEFEVMRVRVDLADQETRPLPSRLSTITRASVEDTVNGSAPRTFVASFDESMRWTLNDRTFEMETVAENEIVKLNTLETWELVNAISVAEMGHPLHIHGVQFQVVERTVHPSRAMGWESIRDGYVDEGWKDTLLLMPGERVRLIVSFKDFTGLFPYHCHNLEHEDQGMMRNYRVDP